MVWRGQRDFEINSSGRTADYMYPMIFLTKKMSSEHFRTPSQVVKDGSESVTFVIGKQQVSMHFNVFSMENSDFPKFPIFSDGGTSIKKNRYVNLSGRTD